MLQNERKSKTSRHHNLEHKRSHYENLACELQKMLILKSYEDSDTKSVLTNDSFLVTDILDWIVSKHKKLDSKVRREAWKNIQVMFDLGIIDLVNRTESRENVDVIFKGYSAWYYFTNPTYHLGPLNHQVENMNQMTILREDRSKVEILLDPAPCDGYVTAINLSFVSKPKLRNKWSVVIFDHISQKNSIEYESRSNSRSMGSNLWRYLQKKGNFVGTKYFREFQSTELNLTPCFENKLVVYVLLFLSLFYAWDISRIYRLTTYKQTHIHHTLRYELKKNKMLKIRAGQFVGIRSHKNETLHLNRLKAKNSSNTIQDRVSGVYRVLRSKTIREQSFYCELCYDHAVSTKESGVYKCDASVLAGYQYHLTKAEAFLLELHLDKMKSITVGSTSKKITADNMNKAEAIERIMKMFPVLTDESPSSRVEYLCVLPKKTRGDHVDNLESSVIHNHYNQRRRHHQSFHYNPNTQRLKLNARLCWALTNTSDLDTVHYFYIYSATEAAAKAVTKYQAKYLHNIDPNNTKRLSKYFNKLNAGIRNDANNEFATLRQTERVPHSGKARRDLHFLACVPFFFLVSFHSFTLSLSLYYTHTHTHTQIPRQKDYKRRTSNGEATWKKWYTLGLPIDKHGNEVPENDDDEFDELQEVEDSDDLFHELPPCHDHIIIYTTKNPIQRNKMYFKMDDPSSCPELIGEVNARVITETDRRTSRKKDSSSSDVAVPWTTVMKYHLYNQAHLRHIIQDSIPAILRLRPPKYANDAINTLLEVTAKKLRVLIEKFVPQECILWSEKGNASAKSAHEILSMIFFNRVDASDDIIRHHLSDDHGDTFKKQNRNLYILISPTDEVLERGEYNESSANEELMSFLRRLGVLCHKLCPVNRFSSDPVSELKRYFTNKKKESMKRKVDEDEKRVEVDDETTSKFSDEEKGNVSKIKVPHVTKLIDCLRYPEDSCSFDRTFAVECARHSKFQKMKRIRRRNSLPERKGARRDSIDTNDEEVTMEWMRFSSAVYDLLSMNMMESVHGNTRFLRPSHSALSSMVCLTACLDKHSESGHNIQDKGGGRDLSVTGKNRADFVSLLNHLAVRACHLRGILEALEGDEIHEIVLDILKRLNISNIHANRTENLEESDMFRLIQSELDSEDILKCAMRLIGGVMAHKNSIQSWTTYDSDIGTLNQMWNVKTDVMLSKIRRITSNSSIQSSASFRVARDQTAFDVFGVRFSGRGRTRQDTQEYRDTYKLLKMRRQSVLAKSEGDGFGNTSDVLKNESKELSHDVSS